MKRYNVGYMGMEEHKNGHYVTFKAYQTMESRLREQINVLKSQLAEYEDDSCIFELDFGDERN